MFSIKNVITLTGLPEEQVRLLADTFLAEVRESRTRLGNNYAEKDWMAIRKLAHTLKPAYTLMGVTEVLDCIDYFLALSTTAPDEKLLDHFIQRFLSHSNHLEAGILAALNVEASLAAPDVAALAN